MQARERTVLLVGSVALAGAVSFSFQAPTRRALGEAPPVGTPGGPGQVLGPNELAQFLSGQDPAGVINLSFIFHWDWAVTPKLDFTIDYDIQLGLTDLQDTNQNFKLQFSWDVMNDFDIDLTLYWYWIGSPQPDSDGNTPENLDLRMVFSIKWEW